MHYNGHHQNVSKGAGDLRFSYWLACDVKSGPGYDLHVPRTTFGGQEWSYLIESPEGDHFWLLKVVQGSDVGKQK